MKTLTAAIISRWKLHSMFFISAEPNMKKPTELPRILDRLKILVQCPRKDDRDTSDTREVA